MRPKDALFLTAAALGVAGVMYYAPSIVNAMETSNDNEPKALSELPPTFTPTSMPTVPPDTTIYPTPHLLDIPIFEPIQIIENPPIAENCIMPFEGAKWNTGLQFTSVIEKKGGGVRTHHLGVDFKAPEGTPVVSVCDGTLIYAGSSFQGEGRNLGNIVVIKYDYLENGEFKSVYALYGHMRNIISNIIPGTVMYKGDFVGEVSHSGGWPADHNHLHFELLNEQGLRDFTEYAKNNYAGDMTKVWSYYPEGWPEGQIRRDFVDPKVWPPMLSLK